MRQLPVWNRVRIGVHTAEATLQGSDYAGQGVHVAARVGDIGHSEEIVISADTLQAAGTVRYPASGPRSTSTQSTGADYEATGYGTDE